MGQSVVLIAADAPVPLTVVYFPVGNDINFTMQFPEISDGTGLSAEFYYKDNRATSDDDPTTVVYQTDVAVDPDNVGACMSVFEIPATDNSVAGSFWWRVDTLDTTGERSTVGFGTLMVEGV